MKRTPSLPSVILWILLGLSSLIALDSGTSVEIHKITVEPGLLSTRLILESEAGLPAPRTYYAPDAPQTLIVDVPRARTAETPRIPASESQLIRDIRVESAGGDALRFSIQLGERVPYRIFSNQGLTVLELNKIQRTQGAYLIDTETQALLDKRSGGEIQMTRLDVQDGTDRVRFLARLSEKAVAQVFALENPSRLVVDLFDTRYAERTSTHPVSRLGVEKVRVGQFQTSGPHPITRLVFDLKEPALYALDSEPSGLAVSFFSTPKPEAPRAAAVPADSAPAPAKQTIEKPGNDAPARSPEPAKAETQPATMKAEPSPPPPQDQEPRPAQEDKFKPKTIAAAEERYSGEIIDIIKFKDADLRDVILYLADFAGLNVVFDPEVRGTVTCNFTAIPWDQALTIILKNNKMGKVIEGNVLRIAPIGTLTREDEEERRLAESKELAGPVSVKTIPLSYSKARDVSALLATKKSSRGEIVIDDRTNTLIITDVKDKLDLLEKLIAVLDTPTPQVSIEARIVEATATFIRNLGVQWGYKGIADPFYGNSTSIQFPNKILADGALIPTGEITKGIGGPLGGYAVNLPAPAFNAAVGFSFANILDTFRLDVALSALETTGDGRIISSPKVTTQNNQQAEIIQGRQIPVQTVANFTVTTRYINAALELRATPQITAEGTIIMNIDIRNDAADFANLVNGIPPLTTQSAKTTVMIPDGGTTVIGGIYRTEDSVTRDRVPFFHKIPILGNLFKSFARTKQNRELLIFITPRILK